MDIFALTLFGSTVWALILIGLFIVICFIADFNKNGFYATLSLLIAGAIIYFWGKNYDAIVALFSFKNIFAYVVIGLLYSMVRTFFKGRACGMKMKDLKSREELEEIRRKSTDRYIQSHTKEDERNDFYDKLKGNVFRWWFMWPISGINWIVTDLLKDFWDYLFSLLKNFYQNILDLGIKSVK